MTILSPSSLKDSILEYLDTLKKENISFEDSKRILNKNGKKYDDIAVTEIKEFMELMADIILANDKK